MKTLKGRPIYEYYKNLPDNLKKITIDKIHKSIEDVVGLKDHFFSFENARMEYQNFNPNEKIKEPNATKRFAIMRNIKQIVNHAIIVMIMNGIYMDVDLLEYVSESQEDPRKLEKLHKKLAMTRTNYVYERTTAQDRIEFFNNIVEDNYRKLLFDKTYSMDPEQKEKYKNVLIEENKDNNPRMDKFWDIFIDELEIIPFTTFLYNLTEAFSEFCQNVDDYTLFIPLEKSIKSNMWAPLLILYMCSIAERDNSMYEYFKEYIESREGSIEKYEELFDKLKAPTDIIVIKNNNYDVVKYLNKDPGTQYLFVDDSSYSGTQITQNIFKMTGEIDPNDINILLGAATKVAKQMIVDSKCALYYGIDIRPFSALYPEYSDICEKIFAMCDKRTVDIFEHKLADLMSTYPHFVLGTIAQNDPEYILSKETNKTLIKECDGQSDPASLYENEELDSCMLAFYKRTLRDLDMTEFWNMKKGTTLISRE